MAADMLPNLIARFTISPGAAVGGAIAGAEIDKHNTTTRGRIIGGVVAGVCLIILIVFAFFYDRRRRRKARQGTKLRDVGEAEMDEEARPMAHPPAADTSYASQTQMGGAMYAGSGYGQGPTNNPAGQQGTEFYRNQ
ncbi:hypothetical protein V8E51_007641 [Hyaloscypha variabilis]|jgi:hypothetical protein|uniref:receptor protein-tyrosine kinase n=1 Tax=Hyaloscypha variabilis (strain UAMH 11265 / GT02V1 / F) TaxID=1149755 RepID=A0A2J6QV34_HYAVF|nr:hypothetical protein L207DRAFT_520498 [Hyaloscypha variabilis F]